MQALSCFWPRLSTFTIRSTRTGGAKFASKLKQVNIRPSSGVLNPFAHRVTGLFTATSIGLIPFRALDSYRCYKIWEYKRRTTRLRAEAGLPQLYDVDDLPDPAYDPNYVHVLSEREQADLHYRE